MRELQCALRACEKAAELLVFSRGEKGEVDATICVCAGHVEDLAVVNNPERDTTIYMLTETGERSPWEAAWHRACALIPCPSEAHFRLLAWSFLGLPADRIDTMAEEVIGGPSPYSGPPPARTTPWSADLLARARNLLLSNPKAAHELLGLVAVGVETEAAYEEILTKVLYLEPEEVEQATGALRATEEPSAAVGASGPSRKWRALKNLAHYFPTLPQHPLPLSAFEKVLRFAADPNAKVQDITAAMVGALHAWTAFVPHLPTPWEAYLLREQAEFVRGGNTKTAALFDEALRRRVLDKGDFHKVVTTIMGRETAEDAVASVEAPLRSQRPELPLLVPAKEVMEARMEVDRLNRAIDAARDRASVAEQEAREVRTQLDKTAGHLRRLRDVRGRGLFSTGLLAQAVEKLGHDAVRSRVVETWVDALAMLLSKEHAEGPALVQAFETALGATFAAERARVVELVRRWSRGQNEQERGGLIAIIERSLTAKAAPMGEQILAVFGSLADHRRLSYGEVVAAVDPLDHAQFDQAFLAFAESGRLVRYRDNDRYGYPPPHDRVREAILEILKRHPSPLKLVLLRESLDSELGLVLTDRAFDHALYPRLGHGSVSMGLIGGQPHVAAGPWPDAKTETPLPALGGKVAGEAEPTKPGPALPFVPARDRSPAPSGHEEIIAVAAELTDGEVIARIPHPDPAGIFHPLAVVANQQGDTTLTWGNKPIASGKWNFAGKGFASWDVTAPCPLLPKGETVWPPEVQKALTALGQALAPFMPSARVEKPVVQPAAPRALWNPMKAKGYLLMEAGRALAEGSQAHGDAWTKAHNTGAWEDEAKFAAAFHAIGPNEHSLEFALGKIKG